MDLGMLEDRGIVGGFDRFAVLEMEHDFGMLDDLGMVDLDTEGMPGGAPSCRAPPTFRSRNGVRVLSILALCCTEVLYKRVYTSSLALEVYAVDT